MILPEWLLTAVVSLMGVLIGIAARQALARMREYHTQAMDRLDALTKTLETARQEMTRHVHDHATGTLTNGGLARRVEAMHAQLMDHLVAHHALGPGPHP